MVPPCLHLVLPASGQSTESLTDCSWSPCLQLLPAELEEQLALLDSVRAELVNQLQRASASSPRQHNGDAVNGHTPGAAASGTAWDASTHGRQLQVDALGAELQVQRRAVVAAQAGRAAAESRLAELLREVEDLRNALAGRKVRLCCQPAWDGSVGGVGTVDACAAKCCAYFSHVV